ncbi:MAG: ABC transporter permease [Epulopiscium sp. Nele67-Bin002]|nr:MAG: ABC transporter permease [Epulopiscium sp. Nele67-Bin002]OON92957.1 MAG: ABC transporter permease [Epulopiscium sp. Nele67-Bin001]
MTKQKLTNFTLSITCLIVGLIIMFPVIYATSLSFMDSSEITQYPPKLISSSPTLDNYKEAFETVPLMRFMTNSLVMSVGITVGQIITASLAAFAFVFFEFRFKKILFLMVLSTMMIPGEVTIISNFLTISSWGWNDTLHVLIIPFMTSAMGIFLIRQYYLTVPKELLEAARIDGCNNFKFFIKILLPISTPVIASLSIYSFIGAWNQYLWPLLTINDTANRTVQIGITMLQSESASKAVILAGSIIISIPTIIAFVIGQRLLVEGMTSGAVKG